MTLIIANVFSFIGATLFIISSFMNTKKRMLYIQGADALFNGIACLIRGSYSGMTTNFIGGARNILTAKGISPKWLTALICALLIIIGTIFNDKGLIGYLPIIASVEYTIYTALTDDIKHIRIALMINVSLWAIHDFYMLLIPSASIQIFVLITTLIKFVKKKRKYNMIVIPIILISLFISVSTIPFIQYLVSKKLETIIYNFSTDLIDVNYPEHNYISQENIITKARLEELKEEVYNIPLP